MIGGGLLILPGGLIIAAIGIIFSIIPIIYAFNFNSDEILNKIKKEFTENILEQNIPKIVIKNTENSVDELISKMIKPIN